MILHPLLIKILQSAFTGNKVESVEWPQKMGILFVGSHSCDLTCIGIFLQFVCNSAQEDCRKAPGRNQHTESTKRNEKRQKSKILEEAPSKKR